ncbi:non-canonical purine NTP pyrophosphatase, RdgB/HAM1 family [Helicobacter sp. 13S00482-2]|nr:non-canonical purine NTP pyrophosphatase, RdgB/HAM1 family [Helicobacter sp. 13S00482-2]
MKIFIASSNQGKIKEIQGIFKDYTIIADASKFEHLKVEENADSFEGNAMIKAKALINLIDDSSNFLAMADDSGLCIDGLDGEPGIYSARYANIKSGILGNSSDISNIECVIENMKKKSLQNSKAKFVACIAIIGNINGKHIEFISRGELEGEIINNPRGKNGFGYDPIFIPLGHCKTLGELEPEEKNKISHRKKALEKIKDFLHTHPFNND